MCGVASIGSRRVDALEFSRVIRNEPELVTNLAHVTVFDH
jgi:hypothetical protein